MTARPGEGPEPLGRGQRLGAIDALRGFALLGVVVVNAQAFAGPAPPSLPSDADRVAAWAVAWLLTAKSYSLFSLLFGLGFALQMGRAGARGQDFGAFFRRRCGVLFLFGVAHGVLLFEGDILTLYAILGLVLLRFRESEPRTLLRWAAGLLAVAVAINLAGAAALAGPGAGGDAAGGELDVPAYRTGDYLDTLAPRAGLALLQAVTQLVLGSPSIFPMFLIGLYLGRRRAFEDVEGQLPLFRSLRRWGLLLGLPLNAVSATLMAGAAGESVAFWLGSAVQAIGAPLLMLGYVGAIVLLLRRGGPLGAVLSRLIPLGQVTLTCYLGSSLLLGLAYYGYGLGLYGRSGAALDLAVGLTVYLVLLLFSTLYVRAFRYGPAEWLWRTLTYGRRQPIRLPVGPAGPTGPSS